MTTDTSPAAGSLYEAIKIRRSVRTFRTEALRSEDLLTLEAYLADPANWTGPWGRTVRPQWIPVKDKRTDKGIKLGTYGMIRNPQGYAAGSVRKDDPLGLADFGYAFEGLVLHLTHQGVGTCWLGGSFTRSTFGQELNIGADEWIPCVSPVGYPADGEGLLRSVIRQAVGANRRKEWSELFMDGAFGQPLTEAAAGRLAEAFESVRRGPSASNKQPWRLLLAEDRRAVHFFLRRTPGYSETMQRIDLGIAMRHFEEACRALELPGAWIIADSAPAAPDGGTEYLYTRML
ncbi:nitroreductase family protein [Paenibacillus glufosinatiresistens]|uniref:nitroreductase family protein n=1 Tax=Paenibacillus glufosinatiresistens TaxID=3070657 RepID=UPI00286E6855|nr:nitroreductase family protein [Paenibacillus sp. YX.27]